MNATIQNLNDVLEKIGIGASSQTFISTLILCCAVVLIGIVVYGILNKVVGKIVIKIAEKTEIKWDDILFRPKFLRCVWMLISILVMYFSLHTALGAYPKTYNTVNTLFEVAILVIITVTVVEFVKSVFLLLADRDQIDSIARDMVNAEEKGQEFNYEPSHSLKGLQQMLIVVIVCIAAILLVSLLLGKNPLLIFSGLSAGAAVLMLVFRDSILGVVAGIQLTANKMVQPGDWITAPKYGVNGVVKEITLATVKVQNFDNTIVTMPPYSLITDAFQNWEGMKQSGGRRIMRAINIDLQSIRYATDAEKKKYAETNWGKDIIGEKPLPNVTILRHFLEHLLATHPSINGDMMVMVRELPPSAEGLPVEIYCFTSNTDWKPYEDIQSEIMDHILAMIPEFGLRVYQRPSGHDFSALTAK